jgi:hypothetical protein
MPVKFIAEDGLYCPKIFCDTCGLEITDCRQGNVCHPGSNPIFVHKGVCDRSQPRCDQYPWMELSHFMLYLGNNVGFKGKVARSAQESVRMLACL